MKALVVDDEPAVRDALERALRLDGHDVVPAADGNRALELLDAGTAPDLLLLDVLMPGTDGLDLSRTLRRRGDRTPVLTLTARDGIGDRVAGLDAGADDDLHKPFRLSPTEALRSA